MNKHYSPRANTKPSDAGEAIDDLAKAAKEASEEFSLQKLFALYLLKHPEFDAEAFQDVLDRSLNAQAAPFTAGLSPAELTSVFIDWLIHLSASPGKQIQLGEKAVQKGMKLAKYAGASAISSSPVEPCIIPETRDRRFRSKGWEDWPFNLLHQSFLLNQKWWQHATTGVRGVSQKHENMLEFTTRQILDVFSPSNFLLTNPEIIEKTKQEGGMNLVRGLQYFLEDFDRKMSGLKSSDSSEFKVGANLAATPGKVVFQNRLIELIQYHAVTEKVHAEPVFIVPAWIMKYYILDLSAQNSLVKYLTEQGFTVFMLSWKNPGEKDRNLGMDDYQKLGVTKALDVIGKITNGQKVHGVGYCLGGTLLSIAAAAMARDKEERFQTLSLFAAQTDFTEAGELMLFINESQVTFLEDVMWKQGFLDTSQMSGAFQLLRSNDLIWHQLIYDYQMGERTQMNDLMAWNADATRMPYKMHSEYLRQLFLGNDLAEGRYKVDGRPIALSDIRIPVFVVGTEQDHVAPWHSVYKFNLFSASETTFVLTSGGHNAGIISELDHPHSHYRVATKQYNDLYKDPEAWRKDTVVKDGSWWPEFARWLASRSGEMISPPGLGAPSAGVKAICDAPGTYVLQE